jgi:hypothetical protein
VYAPTQDLYKRNPGQLAKHVRNNVHWYDSSDTQLREEGITSVFQDLWGKIPEIRQPYTGEPEDLKSSTDLCDLTPNIATMEIADRIARIKRDTVAEPGGILRKHRSEIQGILRLLYRFITACSQQPSLWKQNTTALLLKQGKDPARLGGYRPVTIGSLLSRLYWGILSQKLRA